MISSMIEDRKNKNQNIPQLRFPGFEGEWEEKKLGEVAIFSKGKGVAKKDIVSNGVNECIRYGELYTKYSEIIDDVISRTNLGRKSGVVSKSGDLLIPSSGETPLDIAIVSSLKEQGVLIGGDITIGRFKIKQDSEFFAYYLSNFKKREIARYAQGHSVVHLYSSHFRILPIYVPSLLEQQKIAGFLGSVDEWVENLKRQKENLELYKKGMMQKIFSQKIRFKDENGDEFPDWEEKKLGEVFSRITRKNKENNQNVLTISAQQGLVNQEDYFTKSVSAKNVTGYYLLKKGDFAYNKSYSKGYPMGAIKRLTEFGKGVVSTLYICFRVLGKDSLDAYFEKYFDSGKMNREINKVAQEGARNHGLLNISVGDFFDDIKLTVPSLPEQQKIAGFLTSIDELIESKEKQISSAEQWKKGIMQKMFV